MSSDGEEESSQTKIPVFCTANIPEDIIRELLQTVQDADEDELNPLPALITTTDVASIKEPTELDSELVKTFIQNDSPFLNWTVQQVYDFFTQNIVPIAGDDMAMGEWTWHTFAILDQRTANSDGTVLMGSDAPDFLEEDRVVLKEVRLRFEDVGTETMCWETLVKCPSETGKDTVLSVQPPCLSMEQRRETISYGGLQNEEPYTSRIE